MTNKVKLLGKIRAFVTGLFRQYSGNDLLYHNLQHTRFVVKRSMEIAANYVFSENELFVLSAGAWFHDTGHLVGGMELHEFRSVTIMQNFLEENELPKETIDRI